jgi:hypothetical protein
MDMKYAALLSGFVLIAAVPVLADPVSDLSYKNASAYAEDHSGLHRAVDVPNPKSTLALVAAFTSSSNGEVQFLKLSDSGTFSTPTPFRIPRTHGGKKKMETVTTTVTTRRTQRLLPFLNPDPFRFF